MSRGNVEHAQALRLQPINLTPMVVSASAEAAVMADAQKLSDIRLMRCRDNLIIPYTTKVQTTPPGIL